MVLTRRAPRITASLRATSAAALHVTFSPRAVTSRRPLFALSLVVAALALVASALGLFADDYNAPRAFHTLWGTTVTLYGHGLYKNDTVLMGAGNRGVDGVVLVVALPLLAVAAWRWRRGSERAAFALTGVFAFFAYQYASLAFGAAYNAMFLVYTALVAATLFAMALSARAVAVVVAQPVRLPRTSVGVFMLVVAAGLVLVWLPPLMTSIIDGVPPPTLDSYTTLTTWVLDLGVVAPVAAVAGVLLLRDDPRGWPLAAGVLGVGALLGPAIAAMTWSQLHAGVSFTLHEVAAFIASFAVLSVASMVLAARVLHASPG